MMLDTFTEIARDDALPAWAMLVLAAALAVFLNWTFRR
jgi:hypothetical protein